VRFSNIFKVLFVFCFIHEVSASEKLTIAVASNFLFPAKELSAEFEQRENVKIKLVSASTAKLYAQIRQGAPFDLFLSADKATVKKLVDQGFILPAHHFIYAKGQLVLWAPSHSDAKMALRNTVYNRIAIANPKLAPYGKAAFESLKFMGLMEPYKNKIIYAENVSQAFQYVFHRNVDAALIAYSQLKLKDIENSYWIIPVGYYAPIEQHGGLLEQARSKVFAKKYLEYLTSDEIKKKIVTDFGYANY